MHLRIKNLVHEIKFKDILRHVRLFLVLFPCHHSYTDITCIIYVSKYAFTSSSF